MSDFAEKLSVLLRQLEAGDISPEQFEARSAELIDTVGQPQEAEHDSVKREEIETAAKMLREL